MLSYRTGPNSGRHRYRDPSRNESTLMARFKDPAVVSAAFQPYLEPGEQLRHWAYGVKQPNMLLIVGLTLLAILPGLIAVALLTKEYVVGLTDRRFLVLRF